MRRLAVLAAFCLALGSSQQVPKADKGSAVPKDQKFAEGLAAFALPDDDVVAMRRVAEWAMGKHNFSDKSRIILWEAHPKALLMQPLKYFKRDLAAGRSFLAKLLSDDTKRPLVAEDWSGIPLHNLKLWYSTLNGFSAAINNPSLAPLVAGSPDEDVIGWVEDWTHEKHLLAVNVLSSNFYLRPSQAQLLAAPISFDSGAVSKNIQVGRFRELDVDQLVSLLWKDVPSVEDLVKTIAVATQTGFDPAVIDNKTDYSMLGLYPALELQKAVSGGGLVVTEVVMQEARKLKLTRGQAAVLANGYFSSKRGGKDAVKMLPDDYLFAMPAKAIFNLKGDGDVELRETLEQMINVYEDLLPSQRLAVFWRLYKLVQQKGESAEPDLVNGAAQSALPIDVSHATVLNFVSPAVFEMYGPKNFNESGCKLSLDYAAGSFFARVPLSMRKCFVSGALNASDVPFPQLMSLKVLAEMEARAKDSDSGAVRLGSLAFLMPEEDVDEMKAEDVRTFVSSLGSASKCVCLEQRHRGPWAKALIGAYGEPEDWTASDLLDLGDLLLIFDEDVVGKIDVESLRRAAPYLIERSCLGKAYKFYRGFTVQVSFETACKSGLTPEEGEAFSATAHRLRRALFGSTLANVRLALVSRAAPETPSTTVAPTTVGPDLQQARKTFLLQAYGLSNAAYKNNTFTPSQKLEFVSLTRARTTTYRKLISEALKVPLIQVPKRNFRGYLTAATNDGKLTSLELQQLISGIQDAGSAHARSLVRLMNLTEKDIGLPRDLFCRFAGCQVEVKEATSALFDASFSVGDWLEPSPVVGGSGFCYAAAASGFAAASLTPEDLKAWSDDELYNCLEVFGSVRRDDPAMTALWKHLETRIGDRVVHNGSLQAGAMLLMGNLVGDVAATNYTLLQMKGSVDPLSLLGTRPLNQSIFSQVATTFALVNDVENNLDEINPVEIASLGNIFCGFPLGVAKTIVERKVPLQLFGGTITRCGNRKVLKLLAKDLPNPANWTSSDVAAFGVLVAGLEPSALKKVPLESFSALTPQALAHFQPEHFVVLSPERLSAVSEEAMSVLRPSQLSTNAALRLAKQQVDAIAEKSGWLVGDVTDAYVKALDGKGGLLSFNGTDLYPVDRNDVATPEPETEPVGGEGGSGASSSPSTLMVYVLQVIVLLRCVS